MQPSPKAQVGLAAHCAEPGHMVAHRMQLVVARVPGSSLMRLLTRLGLPPAPPIPREPPAPTDPPLPVVPPDPTLPPMPVAPPVPLTEPPEPGLPPTLDPALPVLAVPAIPRPAPAVITT